MLLFQGAKPFFASRGSFIGGRSHFRAPRSPKDRQTRWPMVESDFGRLLESNLFDNYRVSELRRSRESDFVFWPERFPSSGDRSKAISVDIFPFYATSKAISVDLFFRFFF